MTWIGTEYTFCAPDINTLIVNVVPFACVIVAGSNRKLALPCGAVVSAGAGPGPTLVAAAPPVVVGIVCAGAGVV